MKTTQMNTDLLSSLSYVLKNIALRLRIVLFTKQFHTFLCIFKHATTPLLLLPQSHELLTLQVSLPVCVSMPLLNTVIVP